MKTIRRGERKIDIALNVRSICWFLNLIVMNDQWDRLAEVLFIGIKVISSFAVGKQNWKEGKSTASPAALGKC